ncbi:MAG TPA: hypothetical protein VFM58_13625, partial [Solirubrobacteraceae bacterium]|nr:hypothetical protein [Solirubrobacteraceae bacterium]
MREALLAIRRDQGPDAVIVSQREVAQGVEVVVALDYRPEAEVTHPAAAPAMPAPAPAPAARVAPVPAEPPRAAPPP